MATLYKFPRQSRDVFVDNPALPYVEEFNVLSTKQMVFVMLVSDFYSPLKYIKRKQGIKAMRHAAAKSLGFYTGNRLSKVGRELVEGMIESVETAVEVYQGMQGVDELELLETLALNIKDFIDNGFRKDSTQYVQWMTAQTAIVRGGILSKIKEEEIKLIKLMAEAKNLSNAVENKEEMIQDEDVKETLSELSDEQEEKEIDPDEI